MEKLTAYDVLAKAIAAEGDPSLHADGRRQHMHLTTVMAQKYGM